MLIGLVSINLGLRTEASPDLEAGMTNCTLERRRTIFLVGPTSFELELLAEASHDLGVALTSCPLKRLVPSFALGRLASTLGRSQRRGTTLR